MRNWIIRIGLVAVLVCVFVVAARGDTQGIDGGKLRKELRAKERELLVIGEEIKRIRERRERLKPEEKRRLSTELGMNTVQMWMKNEHYKSALREIEKKQEKALLKRFGRTDPPVEELEKWKRTAEGKELERERERLRAGHKERMRKLEGKLKGIQGKDAERLKALIEKRAEVAKRIRNIKDKIDTAKGKTPLKVRTFFREYKIRLGETAKIEFDIVGGNPPYQVFRPDVSGSGRIDNWPKISWTDTLRNPGIYDFSVEAKKQGTVKFTLRVVDNPIGDDDFNVGEASVRILITEPGKSGFAFDLEEDHYTVKADEAVDVRFDIRGGRPPYRLFWDDSSHRFLNVKTMAKPGAYSHSVVFSTPGERNVHCFAYDDDMVQIDRSVQFTVLPKAKEGAQEEGKPGKEGEEKKPKGTKTGKAGRTPLAPGVYRVHLRVPGFIDAPGSTHAPKRHVGPAEIQDAHPFDITIDADGNIRGRCDYTHPREKYPPEALKDWADIHWENHFTISGKADWKTGEVELSIPDGRMLAYAENPNYRSGEEMEYTADLKGWRIPGPLEPHLTTFYERQKTRFGSSTLGGFPIDVGADGTYRMEGDGWLGRGTDGSQGGLPSQAGKRPIYADKAQGGLPTRASTVKLKRLTHFEVNNDKREEKDWTDDFRRSGVFGEKYRGTANWSLKIVKRIEQEEGEGNGDELVGSLRLLPVKPPAWPPSPVRVRMGEGGETGVDLDLRAFGVLRKNVYVVEDLTQKAIWKEKGGLKKLAKGKYKAVSPGTAYVRAGVKKGLEWSSDTVKVIVLPKAEKKK